MAEVLSVSDRRRLSRCVSRLGRLSVSDEPSKERVLAAMRNTVAPSADDLCRVLSELLPHEVAPDRLPPSVREDVLAYWAAFPDPVSVEAGCRILVAVLEAEDSPPSVPRPSSIPARFRDRADRLVERFGASIGSGTVEELDGMAVYFLP